MNKLCREYISDAKRFFPSIGKKERAYLEGIAGELDECIASENITDKQELYTKYRQPYDVASDYYENCDIEEIIKKINLTRHLKILLFVIIFAALATAFTCIATNAHKEWIEYKEKFVGIEIDTPNNEITKDEITEDEIIEDEITEDEIIEDEIIEDEVID